MHGHEYPELRTSMTARALDALRTGGVVSEAEHSQLSEAYLFLRCLIDALRMVRGNSRDLVLPDESSDEFKFLARRLGHRDEDWESARLRLAEDIHRHRENVRRFFVARFQIGRKLT
jgi:glutamate-ammonia-ligase adenylyltransferase